MDEDEGLDEEAILQRALMLSVAESQPKPDATQQPASEQQQQNEFKDLLQNNDFMMDIAKELGIDSIV